MGKPGVLYFMRLQRVGHNLVTEQQVFGHTFKWHAAESTNLSQSTAPVDANSSE